MSDFPPLVKGGEGGFSKTQAPRGGVHFRFLPAQLNAYAVTALLQREHVWNALSHHDVAGGFQPTAHESCHRIELFVAHGQPVGN